MIPIEDAPGERRRLFPVVMLLILVANVAVFVYELLLGSGVEAFVQGYGLIPAEITSGRPVSPYAPSLVYLTLITSMFIHGGLLHIGGNLLFLWVFGDNVEDRLGHFGFLIFYFLCGITAGLATVLVSPDSMVPSIGASGAIAGVLGGYLVLFPHAAIRTLLFVGPFITITRLSAIFMIGVWIAFQVGSALLELGALIPTSDVAFWAHIGGFFVGTVTVLAWKAIVAPRSRPRND